MKVSIFTPTHDSRFLVEAYESIKEQPFHEWIVLLNNGARYSNDDPRVKVFRDESGIDFVGYLKKQCCHRATGDVLLELDHDDLLMPGCVESVSAAFDASDAGFVYSNTIQTTGEFNRVDRFSESFGWKYKTRTFKGREVDEQIAFDPVPASISRIWYAPHHVRAFRRDAYNAVGGYNPKMRVLDDSDLMSRLYKAAPFVHIDKPLYVYRIHGENAWLKHNAEIQNNVWRLYDQYIEDLAAVWAGRAGLRKLELGGMFAAKQGFEVVDINGGDVQCDLNKSWPFEDQSVGVVRAYDVFEHLTDPLYTMKELYRVLAPGGYALIQVPSTDGRGAFQDPTHKSFWNQNSFKYYADSGWSKYIGTPVRFQAMRLYTTENDADKVCWTRAHLVKLDNGLRLPGEIRI